MKHSDKPERLTVIARSPFHVYYEGDADSVSASNRIGDFDVLPGHADFFSMLTPSDIVIDALSGEDKAAEPVTFRATNGIITVRNNQVMLFVNM